jgi:hypothetical protein
VPRIFGIKMAQSHHILRGKKSEIAIFRQQSLSMLPKLKEKKGKKTLTN